MNRLKYLALTAAAGICLIAGAPKRRRRSASTSDPPRYARMATTRHPPITAPLTDTTAGNGLLAASSLGPAHGFMVRIASTAMSTTTFIPIMGTAVPSLVAARVLAATGTGLPRTSTATRSMTAADMSVAVDGSAKSADDQIPGDRHGRSEYGFRSRAPFNLKSEGPTPPSPGCHPAGPVKDSSQRSIEPKFDERRTYGTTCHAKDGSESQCQPLSKTE
jgi:hypothetical protein